MDAAPPPRSMTAWRQSHYGGADTVTAQTIDVPRPKTGEVLVRVEAVSLNSGDIRLMRGEPRLVRLFFGLRAPRVKGRGQDVAGTVVAVGDGVDGFTVGDAVVGTGQSTLAEYVAVPARRLSPKPEGVAVAVAASLPVAGNTALQALDACRVAAGSRVLVVGAGGGVGTMIVQLAADRGAEVWATCGARAERVVRDLGATRTFDYRKTDLADLPAGHFDAVVDIAGEPALRTVRNLLRVGGTVALVGGDGGTVLGPIPRMLRALFVSRPSRRIRMIASAVKTDDTASLLALAAEGRLTPAIERTYPLDDAGAALAHVDAGHTIGKVVVVA